MNTNWWRGVFISVLAVFGAAYLITSLTARALGQGSAAAIRSVSLEDQEKEIDKQQMKLIYEAIQAYRKKHGDFPKWLSDLVPEFLVANVLISPLERRTGQSRLLGYADPKLQTSYIYEFSGNQAGSTPNRNREKPLTMKEWKQIQMEEFGPVTPLLRCHLYDPLLNLSYSGEFYETALFWETDPNTLALLKRLGPGPGPKNQRTVPAKVVEAENGQPLAGVEIIVSNRRTDLGPLPPRTVTTDAEGRARVPLGDGAVQSAALTFQKKGFAGGPVRWDSEDAIPKEVSVKLKKAVTVGGFVRDSNNHPVPGVAVTINGVVEDDAGQLLLAGYDSVVTDQEGKWSSHSIPKDFKNLNLKLTHAEYLPTEYDQTESDRPGEKEVSKAELLAGLASFKILPGIGVEGIVLDPERQPVSGAEVTLRDTTDTPKKRTQQTDSAGRFRFVVLETGLFQLWVQATGWAPAFKAVEAETGLKPLEFALTRGKMVRGQVLDAEGKPVEGAGVAVSPQGSQPQFSWGTVTDSEGRFVWESAPDGPVMLTATKTGLMPTSQQIVPGSETEIKFRLTKTFMLSGKVVDADTKEPVKQFKTISGRVWNPSNEDAVSWEFHNEKSGSDGQYSVTLDREAPAGISMRVRFMARADGYLPAASPAFPTTGWHSFDFELKKGRGPEGIVKLSTDEPVPGAEVAMLGAGYLSLGKGAFRQIGPANPSKTKTDAQGHFALAAALASPKIVAVHDGGYAEVSAEALAESGEIVLQRWGRVEGVLKFGTRPGPDVEVMIAPKETGPGSLQYDFETFKTKTDAEGRFAFSMVPPGLRQLVQLVPMGGRSWMWSQQQAFEVKAGELTSVVYGGTGRPVIGKLKPSDPNLKVDWSSGHHTLGTRYPRPPQGLRTREEIEKWQKSPEMRQAQAKHRSYGVRIAEDGAFRVENVLPGTYDLHINLTEASSDSPGMGRSIGFATKEVIVDEIPGGVTDEPLDIGEMTVQIRPGTGSTTAGRRGGP